MREAHGAVCASLSAFRFPPRSFSLSLPLFPLPPLPALALGAMPHKQDSSGTRFFSRSDNWAGAIPEVLPGKRWPAQRPPRPLLWADPVPRERHQPESATSLGGDSSILVFFFFSGNAANVRLPPEQVRSHQGVICRGDGPPRSHFRSVAAAEAVHIGCTSSVPSTARRSPSLEFFANIFHDNRERATPSSRAPISITRDLVTERCYTPRRSGRSPTSAQRELRFLLHMDGGENLQPAGRHSRCPLESESTSAPVSIAPHSEGKRRTGWSRGEGRRCSSAGRWRRLRVSSACRMQLASRCASSRRPVLLAV